MNIVRKQAMPQHVAFLRAIYGEKMAPLRRAFEAIGFSDVDSFLASGNLIFDATSEQTELLEARIEKALPETLGYDVAAFVRSADEVARVARNEPFEAAELEDEGNTLYVGFLKDAPSDEAQRELLAFQTDDDTLHVNGCEIYWLCRTRASESSFSGAVAERTLGAPVTLRNIRTVKRIVAKYL